MCMWYWWCWALVVVVVQVHGQLQASDWIYIPSQSPVVARIIQSPLLNWTAAYRQCINVHQGQLAIIRDDVVNTALTDQKLLLPTCQVFWFGYSQNNGSGTTVAREPLLDWCWVDGDCNRPYTNWASGEPNQIVSVTENCGSITNVYPGQPDVWNDDLCETLYCYACERQYCPGVLVANPVTQNCTTSCPSTGNYYPDSNRICQVGCPNGQYIATSDSVTSCQTCIAGKTSNYSGATDCFDCSPGKYSTSGICTNCPAGRADNSYGASSCAECVKGKYSFAGLRECLDCEPGKWTLANASSTPGQCLECPLGQFLPNGTEVCLSCSRGKYRDRLTAPFTCDDCPSGTFGLLTGIDSSNKCTRCSKGKWSNATGATSPLTCQSCPIGKFNSDFGGTDSDSCKMCPPGKFGTGLGLSSCEYCPKGSFQKDYGSTTCNSCSIGKFTEGTGASSLADCKLCPKGKYSIPPSCEDCPIGTFGPKEGAISLEDCQSCPTYNGVSCPDKGKALPFVEYGFYRSATSVEMVKECIPANACPESGYSSTTSCLDGYQGDACGECVPYKYYRKDRECLKCSSQWGKWVLLGVVLVFGLYIILTISTPSDSFTNKLRITLLALQVLATFPRLTDAWSPEMLRFLGVMSLANLNIQFFSLDCSVSVEYWAMWIFKLLIPFVILFVLSCLYLVNKYIRKERIPVSARIIGPRNRFIYSFVLILNILYLYLIVTVVEPFQCLQQSDGTYTLIASPGVTCFDSTWRKYVYSVGVVFGILYVVLLPAFLIILFLTKRHKIANEEFLSKYGALMKPYSKKFFWYELVITAKKICLVVLPDLLTVWISSDVRILTSFISLFLFFVIDCFCMPYRNSLFNRQNLIWSSVIMFVLLSSFVTSKDGTTTSTERSMYSVISIVLIVGSIGYTLATFIGHQISVVRGGRRVRNYDQATGIAPAAQQIQFSVHTSTTQGSK